MQNAGLDELGLNWRYLAFDVFLNTLSQPWKGREA